MITKIKCVLAAVCCLPLSLMAQNNFTIHGKVGSLDAPAKIYLSYNDDGNKVVDSAFLHNGQFTFTGKLHSPALAYLVIKHDNVVRSKFVRQDEMGFYLENSNITVTAKDSIWRGIVKGSATNNDAEMLNALQRPYRKIADSVKVVYNAWTPEQRKDTTLTKPLGAIMRSTQAGYDSVNRAFIARHPSSYISLLTFQQVELGYNFNPDTAAVKFARFPVSLRESATGKRMAAVIEKGKQTNTGVIAMDFTQDDTTGKAVKLSDFRGHYVLVDFWASWCKPCRAENPNLLKAYNKYKGKNFTILGVSLDDEQTRRAWLGAVKMDGLPWSQVSELKGFQSKAAVLYGVSAIPSNFLIDPNGKIIARNLRGEDLEKKLGELFQM